MDSPLGFYIFTTVVPLNFEPISMKDYPDN
jgi:hypothetical protein